MTGFFAQNHNDAKTFMEEHILVQLSPFPSFNQIARKDWLWVFFQVQQPANILANLCSTQRMVDKFGRSHFDFLADCLIVPQQKEELARRMVGEPQDWWIVKPPGTSQ